MLDGLSRPVLVLCQGGFTHPLSHNNSPCVTSQPTCRMKAGCAHTETLSWVFSWDECSHCLSFHQNEGCTYCTYSPAAGYSLAVVCIPSGDSQGKKEVWILSFQKFLYSGWSMVSLDAMLIRGKFEKESCPHWKWKVGLVYANYKRLKSYEIQCQWISSFFKLLLPGCQHFIPIA